MIRFFTALALGLFCSINAQAALIAKWDFSTNLNPTYSQPNVGFTVTGFTPIQSRMVQVGTGGNPGGAGQFISTSNTSYLDSSTLVLARAAGVTVATFSFDIKRTSTSSNGMIRISNNVNSQVFEVAANSSSWTAITPVTFTGLSAPSVTFTFARRVNVPGSSTIQIDNFNIDGVVPEPASMAVFAGLGLVGAAMRRRNRKS
jgi:hypothetical protein